MAQKSHHRNTSTVANAVEIQDSSINDISLSPEHR